MKDRAYALAGKTRWGRAAAAFVPSMVAVGALAFAMLQGALAANVAISASGVDAHIGQVEAGSASAFVNELTGSDGTKRPTVFAALSGGKALDVCTAIPVSLPLIGDVTLKAAGGKQQPVILEDMVVDADLVGLNGQSELKKAEVGVDASTLKETKGPKGRFGLNIGSINATDIDARAWQAVVGSIRLSEFDINFERGKTGC